MTACDFIRLCFELKFTAMKNYSEQKGFSLVELVIFIIIISIIAAIAIPSMLESRRGDGNLTNEPPRTIAFEASAVQTLHVIARANQNFQLTGTTGRFGTLDELSRENLLDTSWTGAGFTKSGYYFSESVTPDGSGFCIAAAPVSGNTGRSFAADEKNIIYTGLDDGRNAPSCSGGILTTGGAIPLQ